LLTLGLYPVIETVPQKTNYKIPQHLWPEIAKEHKINSLRQLARGYGVSHETVRRMILNDTLH
jgi:DNA-binding transcriptional regulator YhcF (GntR family)